MRNILRYALYAIYRWLRVALNVPSPYPRQHNDVSQDCTITYDALGLNEHINNRCNIAGVGIMTARGALTPEEFEAMPDDVTFEICIDGLDTRDDLIERLTSEPIGYMTGYPVYFTHDTACLMADRILRERAVNEARNN